MAATRVALDDNDVPGPTLGSVLAATAAAAAAPSEPPAGEARRLTVVFLSPLRAATGNHTTAHRIAAGLRRIGHSVLLYDPARVSPTEARDAAAKARADIAIGLHAVRSGAHVLAIGLPYIVVMGGTDAFIHLHQPGKAPLMRTVLHCARAVVAFTPALRRAVFAAVATNHPAALGRMREGVAMAGSDSDSAVSVDKSLRIEVGARGESDVSKTTSVIARGFASRGARAHALDDATSASTGTDAEADDSTGYTRGSLTLESSSGSATSTLGSTGSEDSTSAGEEGARSEEALALGGAPPHTRAGVDGHTAPQWRPWKRVDLIPQAVCVEPPSTATAVASLAAADAESPYTSLRATLGVSSDSIVLLQPCGMRGVKAPLWAAAQLREWLRDDSRDINVLWIGPPLDPHTTDKMLAEVGASEEQANKVLRRDTDVLCGGRDGMWYHTPVAHSVLVRWAAEANVVCNTSETEGMCGALLEALCVGTPVVARRNAGNEALLAAPHKRLRPGVSGDDAAPDESADGTGKGAGSGDHIDGCGDDALLCDIGLLASTPAEFVGCCKTLLSPSDAPLRAHLVEAARRRVAARHSVAAEDAAWAALVRRVGCA